MISLRPVYILALLGAGLAWGQPGPILSSSPAAVSHALTTTTTTVSALPNPSVVGSPVVITAAVTGAGATGTVTFLDGTNQVGSAALNGVGTASITTSSLLPGTRYLTATYSGDGSHVASTSPQFQETVSQLATTTALAVSPNPASTGQTVSLTATVTASAGASGTVSFFDGSSPLGTSGLYNGTAVFPFSTLWAGTHLLSASYGGDATNAPSVSPAVSLVVNQAVASTTTLTVSPNPANFGQQVTLTATVTPSSATGTVTFSDGSVPLGSGTLSGKGVSFSTSTLAAGTHLLIANYGGDSLDAPSASSAISLTVNQVTLAVSPNPSTFNQSVTLTATTIPASSAGTVSFRDGGNQIGTSSLSNGSATFSTYALAAGSHTLTVTLGAIISNAVTEVVNKAGSATSLSATPASTTLGQTVNLTATVSPASATGTVTFLDGQASLGNAPLNNGTATFATANLTAGSHSLTASYGGDGNFSGSTSAASPVAVGQGTTATTLTTSLNPANAGQAVTLTAVVAPASATGTVTFKDGSTTIGTATLANGNASVAISTLAVGSHSLTASYGGDGGNSPSASAALIEVIVQALTATTTSLSPSPNPANAGQQVTLTATVVPSSATGTVTFKDGTTTLGTAPLASGSAIFSISTLTVGSHSLTASYTGDGNDSPSTSVAVAELIIQINAGVTLAASPNPANVGQQVTLTAAVIPSSATGTITFRDSAATLGTATLASGSASFSISTLTAGSHTLTASYSGDGSNSPGTSQAVAEVINQANLGVTLTASPNPANAGQQVTLTATVVPSTATGMVTFKDGATTLGTATLASGSAVFSISTLTVGSHSLTASYSGDGTNSPSTSLAVAEVINPINAGVTLAASPNPANAGQQVTLTAVVVPSSATGTVTFKDGTTTLGTAPLANGSANFSISTLTVGSHSLTASYSGDGSNSPGTSQAVAEVINQANAGVTLTASPNPANAGQQVTLNAAVAPSTATGTVTFKDGTTTIGTVTVNSGSAKLFTSTLAVGSHSLTASYSGDGTDSPSTSLAVVEVINQTNPGVTLTASPNPATVGQAVTLTATVSPASATGTVTIYDSVTASFVGGTLTLSNGVATIITSTLKQETHLLQASYSGDAHNAASQSNYVTEEIDPATTTTVTTTTLSVSPATSTPGQAVTLTAAVAPSTATGSVTFLDGSTTLGTGTLSAGSATFSTSSLAAGSHTLTASYAGNATFGASTSNSVTETVGAGTSCVAFPTGFVPFSSVASVSKPDGAGDLAAVGSMSAANFVTYQSLPLPAGNNQQFCGTVFLATGVPVVAYVPTAVERTGNFSPFAGLLTDPASGQPFPGGIIPASRIPGTLAWRIAAALQNSTTTLSVTPSASALHQIVTLTAIVTPLSATGPVTFLDGSATLGTASLVGGTATLTVATLTSGSHSITASYGGDSNNGPSSSSAVTATVAPATPAATRTVLTSSLPTSTFGQAVTLTAVLTPSTATGTVKFLDGSATLGTATLSGGTATFKTSALAVGSHSLSASYGGDATDAPSTSATITETVNSATPVQISSPTALPAAFVGTPYSQTFTATGGVAPFTWSLVSGTQELTMTASGNNGILAGTPKTAGTFTLTVRVQDSAGQANTTVLTWAVNPAAPSISITATAPATIADQPVPSVTLGQAYPVALNGTFRLSFKPNAAGLPANFTNSQVQFVSGGTTSPVVAIPANSTAPVALPAVQLGTVAGTITVQLNSLTIASTGQGVPAPTPAPSQTITVPSLAPIIVPGSVKITNITSSGFQVVLNASSTPRDLSGANLVFTAASGTQLNGTQTFTVSLTGVAGPWFDPSNATAVASGGAFSLTIPFTYSGDTSALGSVSATLTNSVGTSTAVSGGT